MDSELMPVKNRSTFETAHYPAATVLLEYTYIRANGGFSVFHAARNALGLLAI
jgi:hypothetical protein